MLFIETYCSGCTALDAVKRAGYSTKNPGTRARDLLRIPRIAEAVDKLKAEMRENAKYNLKEAMKEADKAIEFAYQRGQPMAVVKGVEHKAKLAGLLIERHDVNLNVINIEGALLAASSRVLPLLLQPPNPDNVIDVTEVEPVAVERK